jgi:hypothetical protein
VFRARRPFHIKFDGAPNPALFICVYPNERPPNAVIKMTNLFRSTSAIVMITFGLSALAQNAVTVQGSVTPCMGLVYPVRITTNTVPPIDTTIYTGPGCTFSFTFFPLETQGTVGVETSCDGGLTWNAVTGSWDPLVSTVVLNLACDAPEPPPNDECSNSIVAVPWADCTSLSGSLAGATQGSMPPIVCSGFESSAANDVWFTFTATDTTTTVEVTGGEYLDLVLEVFAGSCATASTVDCSDNTMDGGQESVTISTTPGQNYFYRIYEFLDITTPTTYSYTTCILGNTNLVDCAGTAGGTSLPGTPCDDNDPLTILDSWTANCLCLGLDSANYDCLQIPYGPNMPGTACTNPATGETGLWSADCTCLPDTNTTGCQAGFWVIQAYEGDTLSGEVTPIPNEVWVWNLSTSASTTFSLSGSTTNGGNFLIIEPGCSFPQVGATVAGTGIPDGTTVLAIATPTIVTLSNSCTTTATGIYTFTLAEQTFAFVWDFGDGTTSTEAYPTHVYATGGPYQLCLTMTDGACCTSTYCDEVSIDENGIYNGMVIDGRPGSLRSGFTISVRSEQPTAITERELLENVALWPNPVEDVIGLSFNSLNSASLSLTIFDLNGRVIRSTNNAVNAGENRHNINVADLDAGMYLLQIANGNQSTSRRFVKR